MVDRPPLDTQIEIFTPENISFHYRVAGPFRRLPAFLIDLILRVLFLLGVFLVMMWTFGSVAWGLGVGLMFVIAFLVDWFYGGLFETFWNGKTPGKWICGLRVISVEGGPVQGWQAVLRNFLRAADAMPLSGIFPSYQLGLWASASNSYFQRLGDMAAGTIVIVEERDWQVGIKRISDTAALELAERLPHNFRPPRSLGRVLARYVERRLTFTPPRRVEMARHLADPLIERFGLPPETHPDHLLCALYQRCFITELPDREPIVAEPQLPDPWYPHQVPSNSSRAASPQKARS